jgi:hypothetical protein
MQKVVVIVYVKDQRRRPEGGEWESIKIPWGNSGYVPKLTQRPSLLTRPRPHSYRETIGPRNWIRKYRNTAEDNNRCKPRHVREYGAQKRIKRQLKSSQLFHRIFGGRIREITTEERFVPRTLESFDPVTQELYPRTSTCNNPHNKNHSKITTLPNDELLNWAATVRTGVPDGSNTTQKATPANWDPIWGWGPTRRSDRKQEDSRGRLKPKTGSGPTLSIREENRIGDTDKNAEEPPSSWAGKSGAGAL